MAKYNGKQEVDEILIGKVETNTNLSEKTPKILDEEIIFLPVAVKDAKKVAEISQYFMIRRNPQDSDFITKKCQELFEAINK